MWLGCVQTCPRICSLQRWSKNCCTLQGHWSIEADVMHSSSCKQEVQVELDRCKLLDPGPKNESLMRPDKLTILADVAIKMKWIFPKCGISHGKWNGYISMSCKLVRKTCSLRKLWGWRHSWGILGTLHRECHGIHALILHGEHFCDFCWDEADVPLPCVEQTSQWLHQLSWAGWPGWPDSPENLNQNQQKRQTNS